MSFLDRAADIEAEYEAAGRAEGVAAARGAGLAEGRELGCEHGFGIGRDLGFYRGWARAWLAIAAARPELVPDRAAKKLRALQAAVDAVPSANAEGAHFAEHTRAAELRFKAAAATLGFSAAADLPSNTLAF
ncbi:hypothetical protein H4R18_002210 [Coemansia javaensis]|uniref:Essential protein Yae1 N-terminal domain-containing protein n=1 Tax=Coemansia javaensis TaxID=2761396 RepID=A0A9W8LI11_9FUNG|nr:hypothetical protein H4R18_002210 [Coemansia javaensis]